MIILDKIFYKEFDFVEFSECQNQIDFFEVDFCHVAENEDDHEDLQEELKTEEVNDEEGFEEPIYKEEIDEDQFQDVIEEVQEDIYEEVEEDIQEEVELQEDLSKKIPKAKIEDFSEDEEVNEANDEPQKEESHDLMDQSEFDLDLNYDRQIRNPEISFEHKWALEERLIHYQPPVLPEAAPPKVFSEPKSQKPQFAPQFPVVPVQESVIPPEMMTSIPDLLTEDDQPVSNNTDIVHSDKI